MKVSAQLRSRLGQALNDAIRDSAPTGFEHREIDRLVDAVVDVLEQCDCCDHDPDLKRIAAEHDRLTDNGTMFFTEI